MPPTLHILQVFMNVVPEESRGWEWAGTLIILRTNTKLRCRGLILTRRFRKDQCNTIFTVLKDPRLDVLVFEDSPPPILQTSNNMPPQQERMRCEIILRKMEHHSKQMFCVNQSILEDSRLAAISLG